MNGYQINFYTLQNRKVAGKPVADWLIEKAQGLGIRGATVLHGDESFGSDHRIHSLHFFEQTEQPIVIVMILSEAEATQIFALVKTSGAKLFYTKTPVEFGDIGE